MGKNSNKYEIAMRIVQSVANNCNIDPMSVFHKNRRWKIFWPRMVAIKIIRDITKCSHGWLATNVFLQSRTTVLKAEHRINRLISVDRALRSQYEKLKVSALTTLQAHDLV